MARTMGQPFSTASFSSSLKYQAKELCSFAIFAKA